MGSRRMHVALRRKGLGSSAHEEADPVFE